MDEKNELHNRSMHISNKFNDNTKADIETSKADIKTSKADIENKLAKLQGNFLSKTKDYVLRLYKEYGLDKVFGRTMV